GDLFLADDRRPAPQARRRAEIATAPLLPSGGARRIMALKSRDSQRRGRSSSNGAAACRTSSNSRSRRRKADRSRRGRAAAGCSRRSASLPPSCLPGPISTPSAAPPEQASKPGDHLLSAVDIAVLAPFPENGG